MTLKVCTIGCGNMAYGGHGPAYVKCAEEDPDIYLAACCDIDERKAAGFQTRFGFDRYYTDYITMLDTEKPDAVCLVVPVELTAKMAVSIIERGYPLIMEKPPGMNREEAMAIAKAAKKHNVPNQVAFNRRYLPLVRKLKELINANFKPDEIHYINYEFFRSGRMDEDFSTTAIHGIDAAKHIAGSDYKYIRFHYQELPHIGPAIANVFMDCTFSSGAVGHLSFCPVSGVTIERATVNAFDNTFMLNIPIWDNLDSPGRLTHLQKDKVVLDVDGNKISDGSSMFETNGFYHENASFFADIKAGKRPFDDIDSAVQSVEIAECIRNRKAEYRL